MTIRATSFAAYREAKKEKCRAKVLKCIKRRPKTGWTRQEISEATGIPEKTVCPRVLELLESGAIVSAGKCRKSRAGRSCNVVRVKT